MSQISMLLRKMFYRENDLNEGEVEPYYQENLSKDTPDILKTILKYKMREIVDCTKKCSLRQIGQRTAQCPEVRSFFHALSTRLQLQQVAIIAEIKKASPSKGVLRKNFHPVEIARSYEENGAACLSVLTEEHFFQGKNVYLEEVRKSCALPILRKDFIIDPYQIYESRALGADCILLIVAALNDAQLEDLSGLAKHLGMDVLVEVHNREELERALSLRTRLIGINNRNLRTFETTLETTVELVKFIPNQCIIVSESGISTREDIAQLRRYQVHSFLIGEAFMIADDPGRALRELLN
jgi:indole-3-glycerol phosphate synthase